MRAFSCTVTYSRSGAVGIICECFKEFSGVFLQKNPQLPNMEFGRRLSVEKEIEKTSALSLANACETTPSLILRPYSSLKALLILSIYTCSV